MKQQSEPDFNEDFEWDEEKANANLKTHRVSFEEAATVFTDLFSIVFNDPDHSFEEQRFIIIGISNKFRLLFVSFTERVEKTRIISARELTAKERNSYEQKRQKNSKDDLRDEYNLDELEIAKVGKGWTRQNVWAVCVTNKSEELTPLKLYKVEFYPQLSKAKILSEDVKADFYPQEWFLSVEFTENVKNVLEKVG